MYTMLQYVASVNGVSIVIVLERQGSLTSGEVDSQLKGSGVEAQWLPQDALKDNSLNPLNKCGC